MLRPVTTGGTPIETRLRGASCPAVIVLAALCAAARSSQRLQRQRRDDLRPAGTSRRARAQAREHSGRIRVRTRARRSTLELDCAVTRDGIVVVSHDPVLNPDYTRDDQGRFLDAAGPPIVTLTLAGAATLRRRPAAARHEIRGALSGSAGGRR